MAIKDELKEEVKQEGGGKDELEALDALEKEAAEYNKVCPQSQLLVTSPCSLPSRMQKSTAYSKPSS